MALGAALPAGRALRDRWAVAGAAGAVVGQVAEARARALGRGGVSVRVADAPWRVWTETGTGSSRVDDLEGRWGVEVELPDGARDAELRYDALGLGRVSSLTIVLVRGGARERLVVSAYGRVVRR